MHTIKQLIYKLDQMNLDYYEVESDINDMGYLLRICWMQQHSKWDGGWPSLC